MKVCIPLVLLLIPWACNTSTSEVKDGIVFDHFVDTGLRLQKPSTISPKDTSFAHFRGQSRTYGYLEPGLYLIDESYGKTAIHRNFGDQAVFLYRRAILPGRLFQQFTLVKGENNSVSLRIIPSRAGDSMLNAALEIALASRFLGRFFALVQKNTVRYLMPAEQIKNTRKILLRGNYSVRELEMFAMVFEAEVNWVRKNPEMAHKIETFELE